jgi:hypothetical protein
VCGGWGVELVGGMRARSISFSFSESAIHHPTSKSFFEKIFLK